MNFTIQLAQPEDEPGFVFLSQELSRYNRRHHPQSDNFDAVLRARADRARRLFQSEDPHQLILIAKVDDQPIGYALAVVDYPDPSNDNGTEWCGLLDEVYVDESARGLGIGSKLIDSCMEWIRHLGAKRVKLQMYDWNDQARHVYEKWGFTPYAISFEKTME